MKINYNSIFFNSVQLIYIVNKQFTEIMKLGYNNPKLIAILAMAIISFIIGIATFLHLTGSENNPDVLSGFSIASIPSVDIGLFEKPVISDPTIENWQSIYDIKIIDQSNGDSISAYYDDDDSLAYVMKLDVDGNHLWGSPTQLTNTVSGFDDSFPPVVYPDGSGGANIVYGENDALDRVWVAHVESNGNLDWEVKVGIGTDAFPYKQQTSFEADDSAGIYFIWADPTTGDSLYLNYLQSNGTFAYGADVTVATSITFMGTEDIAYDATGDCIYFTYSDPGAAPDEGYVNKYCNGVYNAAFGGPIKLNTNGTPIEGLSGGKTMVLLTQPSGGVIVVYQEENVFNSRTSILGKKFEIDGTIDPDWDPNGIDIANKTGTPNFEPYINYDESTFHENVLLEDGHGNFILVAVDIFNWITLHMQKVDIDTGDILLGTNGKIIMDNNDYGDPGFIPSLDLLKWGDSFLMMYDDASPNSDPTGSISRNIIMRFDWDGNPLWPGFFDIRGTDWVYWPFKSIAAGIFNNQLIFAENVLNAAGVNDDHDIQFMRISDIQPTSTPTPTATPTATSTPTPTAAPTGSSSSNPPGSCLQQCGTGGSCQSGLACASGAGLSIQCVVPECFDRSDGSVSSFCSSYCSIVGTTPVPTGIAGLDTDNDGVSDVEEEEQGTDPNNPDSDDDGLLDGEELDGCVYYPNSTICQDIIFIATDPLDPDSDDDGLTDGFEAYVPDLDPNNPDSDDDGVGDGDEDLDNDDLINLDEQEAETNPLDPDTDNDTLTDGQEVHDLDTDPTNPDTDNDGLNDNHEIELKTDPNNPDTDGEGLKDGEEIDGCFYIEGSTDCSDRDFTQFNPTLPDTNNNGISDYDEALSQNRVNFAQAILPDQFNQLQQFVVAVGLLITSLIIGNIGIIPKLSGALSAGLINALPYFLWRKNPKPWGVILATETKEPVAFAVIKLLKNTTPITQVVSDLDGKYSMSASPGNYTVSVNHDEYKPEDKDISITDEQIALDFYLKSHSSKQSRFALPEKSKRRLNSVNKIIYIIGLFASTIITLAYSTTINSVILFIYLVFALIYLFKILNAPRYYGEIVDETGKTIKSAVVRLLNEENANVDILLSDEQGRFNYSLRAGDFNKIHAYKAGYNFLDAKGIGTIEEAGLLGKVVKVDTSKLSFGQLVITLEKAPGAKSGIAVGGFLS